MTKQELIDYCFMYWQHVSKKILDLMKGFPCKYVDNKLGYHSLTCGCDNEFLCALHVNASEDKVSLLEGSYQFHYDYIEKGGHTYAYDEIGDKVMDRFIGLILYIAHHEYEIMQRMRQEVTLINYIQSVVNK